MPMAKLGGHALHVTNEVPAYSVNIPEKPTEKGFSITDHVEKNATTFRITGLIVNPNAGMIRNKLMESMFRGDLMEYDGRNGFMKVALVSFESEHDYKVANGMRFTATLREVRTVQTPYESAEPVLKTQIKPVTHQGTQQTMDAPAQRFHVMRAGDSLYSIAPKYGTSGPAVVGLNPGLDPKRIQIGQKVRVI